MYYSRQAWKSTSWVREPVVVPLHDRTEFFVHYDGADVIRIVGVAVPKRIERIHLTKGWIGIGYNFVVDQNGDIYEGRGWSLLGAHCENHNRTGIGVQVAIGNGQHPTDVALRSVRSLYTRGCALTGRRLLTLGHRDRYATECPGRHLYTWVHAGMPVADTPLPVPVPHHPVPDTSGGMLLYARFALDPTTYNPENPALSPKIYEVWPKGNGTYGSVLLNNSRDALVSVPTVVFTTEAQLLVQYPLIPYIIDTLPVR